MLSLTLTAWLFATAAALASSPLPPRASIFAPAVAVLERAVAARTFPGAVALVADRAHGTLLRVAVGNYTYGAPTPRGQPGGTPVALDTVFDMASCSKVAATTTAVARLFGDDAALLDAPVEQFLPGYAAGGKAPVTIRNCLLHDAGLPPDPTPFDFWDPRFGCAGAPLPGTQSFGCSEKIYAALLAQTLTPGATPGAAYVYSDLSFITLMYVVGTVALERGLVQPSDFLMPRCQGASEAARPGMQKQCAFEAYVRLHVFGALAMHDTGYLPAEATWGRCQPTWVPDGEPGLHGHALQGRVEDGNCFNMGGVAGHAGVFSTADDLALLMRAWMKFDTGGVAGEEAKEAKEVGKAKEAGKAASSDGVPFLTPEAIDLFVQQNNHSQSSRALGWNTNDETAQPDGGWGQSCGNLSARTFTHVGFTGTQLCGDPANDVFTVLLTARVFGTPDTSNSTGIHAARKAFNSEVAAALRLPAYPGR